VENSVGKGRLGDWQGEGVTTQGGYGTIGLIGDPMIGSAGWVEYP